MNWVSAIDFALAAFNFALMIWSISNNSWAFVINFAAGIYCLLMGIVSLNK